MSPPTFHPLASILKDNKLTGPNYVDWKRNLNIVLTADSYTFVLTTHCPAEPAAKKDLEKWTKANEMTKCYMLASMSNVIQHRHQNFATASEMMNNLQEMFSEQNCTKRQLAMKNLMNTKMAEETSVREHILQMINYVNEIEILGDAIDHQSQVVIDYVNEIEILGDAIDHQSQVDAILQSLPDSFNQFKLNYKMDLSLSELMNSLQAAEELVKKKPSVLISENVEVKGKGGVKKANGKGNGKQRNCFFCEKPGHWKRNCRAYLASLKDNKEGVPGDTKTE